MWKKYFVMLINYSPFHNIHILRSKIAGITTSKRCSLWGANWMSCRLTSLQSVNVTRTSSVVITPWYQTGSNNTNKTHCWGFRLFSFLETYHTELQSISTTNITAVTTLNKVRGFAQSIKILTDIMCRSFVSIPWPSNLYCVNHGVSSGTKHIGVEYNRVKCQ